MSVFGVYRNTFYAVNQVCIQFCHSWAHRKVHNGQQRAFEVMIIFVIL